jgi:GntR family transcriptional regulator
VSVAEAQPVLEAARTAYSVEDKPIEVVINVFPAQQWRLSYEWSAE